MDVFVWSADADTLPAAVIADATMLSGDEGRRAAAFRFERDRARFVAARRLLRHALGQHLGMPPAAVPLTGAFGSKPLVDAAANPGQYRFSLTRSTGLICIGIARQHEIGVDVETDRPDMDIAALAPHVFSPEELAAWSGADAADRTRLFYRAWARKEALGKAAGLGISGGPDTIAVPLDALPGGAWIRVPERADSMAAPTGWILSDLHFAGAAAGSLAVAAPWADCAGGGFDDVAVKAGSRLDDHGGIEVPAWGTLMMRRFGRDPARTATGR
ncbi:MAG: 4'-phosphopantetheinyl transferase superfamily protein [Gammaproteobacteria bacterium]|nr:4'-phosphopantetheinyl transferase superfamily protein [Gammaproteobacteria bacterium]